MNALAPVLVGAAGVLAPGLGGLAPWSGAEAHYVDTSLDLDGRLLSWELCDLEGDPQPELVVTLERRGGQRELVVYGVTEAGVEREPRHRLPVIDGIVAWTAADVRPEPGREVVFLTRGGAWSYSLTRDGYRGNVEQFIEADLIYDVSDSSSLPYYGYVLPGPEGRGDSLLLPGRTRYGIWSPAAPGPDGGEPGWELTAEFEADFSIDEIIEEDDRPGDGDGIDIRFDSDEVGPFVAEDLERASTLLADSHRYRAPALVDLDGNGELDLVVRSAERLAIHAGKGGRLSAEPTRVEELPEDLRQEGTTLRLSDLDGDGDLDLLAHVFDEPDGFENGRHQVLVYENDGRRLVSEKPVQVLRFEAAMIRIEVADVDGDGRPDLALRKLVLPSFTGAISGLNFTFSHLVYLGEKRAFSRKPALKTETVYDEESFGDLIANRELRMDCDGDGLADLVEIDVQGTVVIRRLERESSFFGGDSWSLESGAWKRYDAGGSIESLTIEDANGDGLADIFSASSERLTILFSRRGGAAR